MASLRMTLLDLLNKSEQGADPNFLRDGVQLLAQELMDAEVTELVGAEPHQRTAGRTTYRNGYRDREWDTRVGTLELQIPKLRQGTYFPSLLEPRRRHERALLSVVQEAYIHGVSTRAVDNLAEALGIKSISKDQVSRMCKELDTQVHAFRTRRLDGEFPYLFLDATFEKVRENGRVISMAVAKGVRLIEIRYFLRGGRPPLSLSLLRAPASPEVALAADRQGKCWAPRCRDLDILQIKIGVVR